MDSITLGLSLASQFAPGIIKYFTNSSTAGDVAGKVIDIAKTVTGKDTPQEAATAMQADPALAMQFKTAVMANDSNLEMAHLADTQNARQRDVDLAKLGRTNNRANMMIALDALGLVVCLIVLAVYRASMSGEVATLLSTIASIFGLCLRDAHQFEFGSSRGSVEKTELIKNLQR